jgi:hypothetical protein
MAQKPRHGFVAKVRDNTRRYIEELRADNSRLRAELEHHQRCEDRFLEIEAQNSSLAALYAASYQLHATVRRAEVLLAIQEIVINLVGSEELAVLDVADLAPLASVGVDPARLAGLSRYGGLLGRALDTRAPAIAEGALDEAGLTAAIPLVIDDRVIGAIAIFRLLPQKPGIEAFDRELFDLIATHAATALYCAELHERRGAQR